MTAGDEVTVQGVVTSTPGSWGGSGFFLQDETAGTYAFEFNNVNRGDEVRFTGTIGEFNGEFQLSDLKELTVIGEGVLPEPIVITPAQLNDSVQGQLVTLESVTIGNLNEVNSHGTFEFDADLGNESVLVRVDNRTGLAYSDFSFENGDVVDVTGPASVFNGTYQLKPRGADDIVLTDDTRTPDPVDPPRDDLLDLTILHTNDIHSRIDDLGKAATYINSHRDAAENSLYLDAGDIFSGSPVNDINLGEPIIDILNEMKLDALVIGNHEFDYGQDVFAERVLQSEFPWLSANMTVDQDIPIEQPDPYTIFEFGEFDVAVFSLTQNPPATAPSGVVGIEFHDYVETALAYQEELEANADIIIALTHIGYGDDRSLAEEVDYFDVIIGGHTHTVLNTPQVVNGTPIAQAGGYGSHVGRLNLSIDPDTKEVVDVSGGLQTIGDLTDTDSSVQAIIDDWNEQMDEILNIVIGETDTGLSRDGRYDQDVSLGNFWTDAMAFAADADIAFTNNGGIRDSIASGDVTIGDIYRIEPFDNQVMLIEMTGEAIKNVIEYSFSRGGRNQIDLQSSGLHYTILTNASGQYSDAVLELDGTPLEMTETYHVAVPDYIGTGGSGYDFEGDVLYNEVTPMTTAMIDYAEFLTGQGEKLNYYSEGRISIEVDPNAGGPDGDVIGSTVNGLFSSNKSFMDVGIGNLYADAIRAKGNTDIGLLNGSSVTGNIPPGLITAEQIEALDVYENQVVIVETTGAKLKEMILAQSNYHRTVDIQTSGLHYILVKGEGSQTFSDVILYLEDGTPVADEDEFTVAYNDFMHNGGHYTLSNETLEYDAGLVWEAVIDYVQAQVNPVDYVEGERIQVQIHSRPTVEDSKVVISDGEVNQTISRSTFVIDLHASEFEGISELFFSASQISTLKGNQAMIHLQTSTVSMLIPAALFGTGDVTLAFEEVNPAELNENSLDEIGQLVSDIYNFTIVQDGELLSDFGDYFITLHLPVKEDLIDDVEKVSVHHLKEEESHWENIGGSLSNGFMTAETNHFSLFAVLEVDEELEEPVIPGQPVDPTHPVTPGLPDSDDHDDDSESSEDGDKTSKESDQDETGKNELDKSDKDKRLPDTATNSYNWIVAGILLLLVGTAILVGNRRRIFV
ncbi:5'-nucleotidase C-terminal domain-containing protein [Bacillus tamaricis]|uniref:5'-nucleotidase C-terminal domain-containing protein n=2 Tax=Evansella tamaricis TaxID=2069301 RepID=A0ABS6JHS4_9BACI|nr:5'-nucleotidase C-terminal domain-containing protein [Evansella tamaricis]